ncbi:hypothetical protein [Edaphocola aurantiacus]|uniref:hypothetical protein n=1 Tax=Edaphocola aurantiacus TaxID=2601682 RepID=UPI001C980653|nr:hypothetical protein [Edaphocola aurantiacus]
MFKTLFNKKDFLGWILLTISACLSYALSLLPKEMREVKHRVGLIYLSLLLLLLLVACHRRKLNAYELGLSIVVLLLVGAYVFFSI